MNKPKHYLLNITRSESIRSLILLLLICLPLLATLSDYGITSDEPIYMEAAWNIKKWLSLDLQKMFNRNEIDRYWKTDQRRNVHPSGVKWLYLIAQKTIFWEKDPYRQNGVLNVLIFSISLTIFLKWWSEDLFIRAVFYIIILFTIPRFFGHTHFPATDIPMTSLLILLVAGMDRIIFHKSFWILGIILGFFISIKITSFLLTLPVLAAAFIWYRKEWKRLLIRMIFICIIGVTIFYVINPDYWFDPVSRLKEFVTQSITRRSWTPFTVFFDGHFYDYRGPFYYPFTIFLITTPILHILLLLTGLASAIFNKTAHTDFKVSLIFLCLIFPFILLTLPISPAHDGIRYLLPAFPFAACFMTLGLERIWAFIRDQSNSTLKTIMLRWIVAVILLIIFAGDLKSPARYPPFELSYYNRIVGGISGAFKRGYETTYWWEILNNEVLERLNETCFGSYVYFPISPMNYYFKHMNDFKKIEFIPTGDIKKAQFMLIFGRPYVNFWEVKTWPLFKKLHEKPILIWGIKLDSIPILNLYRISG